MEVLILVVIVVLAVVGVGWYLANWFEEQRAQEYAAVASKLGLEFSALGDAGFLESLSDFSLFQSGRGRKLKHLLRGQTQNVEVAIFVYRYVTGGGKSSQTHQQTVICFDSPWLDLPKFELRPAHFGHRLAKLFGYQDIAIPEFPEFNKKYLLRGEREESIRELFSQEVAGHLESLKGLHIAGWQSRLILYRPRKRLRGYDLRGFLEEAFGVYSEFKTANTSEVP
jgi:hypothetical protein